MNGYQAVAKILKKEGFEWLACFPSNPIIEAVAVEGIRPIVFRQERGGIMAADGYSRLMSSQGKYGVFACQGGPGSENAFGGFAQAWADSVPVLFIPDGPGNYKVGVAPNFSAGHNFQHIMKFAAPVTSADAIPALMRRATESLKNGRPGPVMVEMHRDAMGGDVPDAAVENYVPTARHIFAPSASDISDVADQLINARMPAIWAGQGVLHAGATAELQELAELTQIPVMTTMPGKSAIDERHPLALGAANRTAPKPVWTWLKESDVLFAIGASLTITNYGIDLPPGKFLIHCTNNPADISKEYQTDIGLVGDAGETLRLLIDEIKGRIGEDGRRNDTSTQESIAQVRAEWEADWNGLLNSDMLPINPYRLLKEIGDAVDHENTVMTHDAGHPRGSDDALLHRHKAAYIHRLGQEHPPRLRNRVDDRREDGDARTILRQLHG